MAVANLEYPRKCEYNLWIFLAVPWLWCWCWVLKFYMTIWFFHDIIYLKLRHWWTGLWRWCWVNQCLSDYPHLGIDSSSDPSWVSLPHQDVIKENVFLSPRLEASISTKYNYCCFIWRKLRDFSAWSYWARAVFRKASGSS